MRLVDAVIDDAADKFLSDEYLYLDDPSPGDYFDNITSAAKVLAGALNEVIGSSASGRVEHIKNHHDD